MYQQLDLCFRISFSLFSELLVDGHVFGYAGLGAFFFHGGDVFALEIDNTFVVAGLLHIL